MDFELHDEYVLMRDAYQNQLLWRKPYVDGAVRELTSGNTRSAEQLRQAVEQMMLAANNSRADVRTSVHAGHTNTSNVRVIADIDQTEDMLKSIRRDPDEYRDT